MATRERFEWYADLDAALRQELGRLRIRYRVQDLNDAIHRVESNLRLVHDPAPAPFVPLEPRRVAPAFSHAEASAFLAKLAITVRSMPSAIGRTA